MNQDTSDSCDFPLRLWRVMFFTSSHEATYQDIVAAQTPDEAFARARVCAAKPHPGTKPASIAAALWSYVYVHGMGRVDTLKAGVLQYGISFEFTPDYECLTTRAVEQELADAATT